MPLKQDRTSYNVSNNLKTSMQAKGFDTSVKEGNTYYEGSGAEIHLALFMLSNGKFRTVSSLATTFCDIVDPNDTALVRMWVEEELGSFIGRIQGVESSQSTFDGLLTWTHTIVYNGQSKVGTDTKKVDAIAKSLRKLIDDLQ